MGDRVEAVEAEERVGPEKRQAERPVREPGRGEPAGRRERRQRQRVGPHREAAEQAGERAAAGAAAPEEAAEDRRRELGDGGERDQAERDQRARGVDRQQVEEPQGLDAEDGDAARPQEARAEVGVRLFGAERRAQEEGQHEVVRHHGRERHGLDDHHAGRGRQAAEEDEERERVVPLGERQAEHEGVGIHRAVWKAQAAGEGDRQHEQIDQQEVEWKEPGGARDVALVRVLDHRHLELAGQEEDGGERGEDDPHPVGGRPRERGERRELGLGEGAVEERAQAVVQPVDDPESDGEEGDELDHRLEGDRRHQSLVVLGDVEMPRAEEDGEEREQRRDSDRGLHEQRILRQASADAAHQHQEAGRHGLELQRQVRHDADDRDEGDDGAEHPALAVARCDEVGDRGDALPLADAHHLAQQDPGQRRGERRPEIDRQEADAGNRRASDAAVERPGGAIDRHRQCVDVGVRDRAAPAFGAAVAHPRDGEQRPEIGERDEDDRPGGDHGSRSPTSSLTWRESGASSGAGRRIADSASQPRAAMNTTQAAKSAT